MKFAERSRFSPLKMDHTDVRELERKWRQERNMAVAADSELSETERQDTLDILHDPYVGYGLNVGME